MNARATIGHARFDLNMLAFSGSAPRTLRPVLAPVTTLNVEAKNYARSVTPKAARRTSSGKLTTKKSRAEHYSDQAERGREVRTARCMAAFGTDSECDTLTLASRLGLNITATQQCVFGWRKLGLIADTGRTIDRVKVWRLLKPCR